MTTTNPYAPPGSDAAIDALAPVPPGRSAARRASFILAAAGFVVFWGAALFAASQMDNRSRGGAEAAAGLACLLAMLVHLVGIGIVFAVPRGRRLVPALLNAASLVMMIALLVYGMTRP